MKYTVLIGSLNPEDCHSELEVENLHSAKVFLHAFARKEKPEYAIANIGDFHSWEGNLDFANIDISANKALAADVAFLIAEEEKIEDAAVIEFNLSIPDVKIEPYKDGLAQVSSLAMQYDATCAYDKLGPLVEELTREYQELIAGGLLSMPVYSSD